MSKADTFFERLISYAESQGIRNLSGLSEALGYEKPEKLYRLKRDKNARPSFEVVSDITKLFVNLNLRWLITGIGESELSYPTTATQEGVEEPESVYLTKAQEQKKLLKEKERVINQQKETISALQEAYSQVKLRLEERDK